MKLLAMYTHVRWRSCRSTVQVRCGYGTHTVRFVNFILSPTVLTAR